MVDFQKAMCWLGNTGKIKHSVRLTAHRRITAIARRFLTAAKPPASAKPSDPVRWMEQRPPIHVRSPFLQGAGRPARAARNQAAPSTTSASPQSQAATALGRMSEATITSSSPRSSHYRLRRRPRRVRRCIAEGADAGVGPHRDAAVHDADGGSVHRHIVKLPWQRAVDPLLELGSGQRYPFRAERAQTGAGDGEVPSRSATSPPLKREPTSTAVSIEEY